MKVLKAIDLFSGIGGIRLGLQNAGFKVVYSNDFDKYCKITFENYFHEELDVRKIEDVPLKDIPNDIDLLAAGFPCQPYSLAGLKRGFHDPRGSLFGEVVKIIADKRPKAFLLENVKYLKGHDKGETLQYMLSILSELGYFIPEPKILNSKFFGVPQNRERIYIVGFLSPTNFEYPTGNDNSSKLKDILEKNVDESYYLSQRYLDGLIKHRDRHIKKGNGFGLQILNPEGISNTLVVGNMGRERNLIEDKTSPIAFKKNNRGVRKLTIKECVLLQGFPKDFSFEKVSRTQAYKQLGNTVTVPVIKRVAVKIREALEDKSIPAKESLIRKENAIAYSSI